MATKHWGRDAFRDDNSISTYGGNQAFADILLYHMLRVAGFTWLWECDGEVGPHSSNPNHCDDGNMEEVGVTKWDAVGTPPTRAKDTTTVRSGKQSLKIVTDTANEGVVSDPLLTITNPTTYTGSAGDSLTGPTNGVMVVYDDGGVVGNKDFTNCRAVCSGFTNPANNGNFNVRDPYYSLANTARYMKIENPVGVAQVDLTGASIQFQRKYEIMIWALIGSGLVDGYWKVEVDPGDGSFVELGQLALGDDWQLNHFSFYAVGTGARYVRITDTLGGRTCYIDGVLIFRSSFEYAPSNVYGPDAPTAPTGVITNPDRFSVSSGYTCGSQDIGKWLFVWDDDPAAGHNKNTGFYKIIADLGSGVVQLDLRSGTAALITTTTNVRWRIVDVDAQSHNDWAGVFQRSMGFGVQSPHSSGWRYFSRMSQDYSAPITVWSAPDDEASFNWSTGQFYTDGPSTQRNMTDPYVWYNWTRKQCWNGLYLAGGNFQTRDFFISDADRNFFAFAHLTVGLGMNAMFFVGYTGADVDHPGIEEFVSMVKWENPGSYQEIAFGGSGYFTYYGIGFDSNGMAVPSSCGFFGWQSSNAFPFNISFGGPNPWSGNEWLLPFCIVRDPDGVYGCYSERDADVGLYIGRTTMANLTTFDSHSYFHVLNEVYMAWSGEAIV